MRTGSSVFGVQIIAVSQSAQTRRQTRGGRVDAGIGDVVRAGQIELTG